MRYLNELNKWIQIIGYEGYYEITSDGLGCTIRSIDRFVEGCNSKKLRKGKLCKFFLRNNYYSVTLSRKSVVKQFSVHRLLSLHYIENPSKKLTVNHIDGVKTNNALCNLEWATMSEQMEHAVRTGLFKPVFPIKKGDKLSETTKNKMSKIKLGKKLLGSTCLKISNTLNIPIFCVDDNKIIKSMEDAAKYAKTSKTTFHRKFHKGDLINGKKFVKWFNQQNNEK